MRPLAPAWPWSSWLTSREPHEVSLTLISPPLTSQPSEAAPEEVLCHPPREGLEYLLVEMGRTRPLEEPRRGPQAGKSGDPRSQNTDSLHAKVSSSMKLELATRRYAFFVSQHSHYPIDILTQISSVLI